MIYVLANSYLQLASLETAEKREQHFQTGHAILCHANIVAERNKDETANYWITRLNDDFRMRMVPNIDWQSECVPKINTFAKERKRPKTGCKRKIN
jgi:hypothetical protein